MMSDSRMGDSRGLHSTSTPMAGAKSALRTNNQLPQSNLQSLERNEIKTSQVGGISNVNSRGLPTGPILQTPNFNININGNVR